MIWCISFFSRLWPSTAALTCPPLYHAHDDRLTVSALHTSITTKPLTFSAVHVPRLAADISLINFYFAVWALAELSAASLQAQANAMQHEPSRLLSYADSATDLVRANAILAIGDHPNHDQPLLQ